MAHQCIDLNRLTAVVLSSRGTIYSPYLFWRQTCSVLHYVYRKGYLHFSNCLRRIDYLINLKYFNEWTFLTLDISYCSCPLLCETKHIFISVYANPYKMLQINKRYIHVCSLSWHNLEMITTHQS